MAVKIAIAATKGGVSKTTTAFELANSLARKKKKVLLFDLDPQGDCTTWSGIDREGVSSLFLSLTEKNADLPIVPVTKNLDIVPSNTDLEGFESSNITGKEVRLKKLVKRVDAEYDYIIYDTQPAISFLVGNALIAADYVITPLTCDEFAIKGITKVISLIDEIKDVYASDLELGGILITNFHKGIKMHREALEFYNNDKNFSKKLFKTVIRQTQLVRSSVTERKSVYDMDKNSNAAKDYQNLASEIIRKLK